MFKGDGAMEFVETEDCWDVVSYRGDSAGTSPTSPAGVHLSPCTCVYLMVNEQRTEGVRSGANGHRSYSPHTTHFYVCHFHKFSIFLYFQSSKKSLLMKNKHMKLISVSKTRLKSLFSLLGMFLCVLKMKTIFLIRGLEVQNTTPDSKPKGHLHNTHFRRWNPISTLAQPASILCKVQDTLQFVHDAISVASLCWTPWEHHTAQ